MIFFTCVRYPGCLCSVVVITGSWTNGKTCSGTTSISSIVEKRCAPLVPAKETRNVPWMQSPKTTMATLDPWSVLKKKMAMLLSWIRMPLTTLLQRMATTETTSFFCAPMEKLWTSSDVNPLKNATLAAYHPMCLLRVICTMACGDGRSPRPCSRRRKSWHQKKSSRMVYSERRPKAWRRYLLLTRRIKYGLVPCSYAPWRDSCNRQVISTIPSPSATSLLSLVKSIDTVWRLQVKSEIVWRYSTFGRLLILEPL